MGICSCVPQVKITTWIHPGVCVVKAPVALTICNCDRRQCTVNGCHAYSTQVGGGVCTNGHRF